MQIPEQNQVDQPVPGMAVVWHEHHFPPGFDHDDDEADERTGRFDALEYADGRFAVWSAEHRRVVSWCATRKAADDDAAVRAGFDRESFLHDRIAEGADDPKTMAAAARDATVCCRINGIEDCPGVSCSEDDGVLTLHWRSDEDGVALIFAGDGEVCLSFAPRYATDMEDMPVERLLPERFAETVAKVMVGRSVEKRPSA